MNKQELIKRIEDLPYKEGLIVDKIDISRKGLLELVSQLDEPEKVTIPQFVADWIEYCKFTHVDLQHALIVGNVYFYNYANQKDFSKLKEFLETENNQEIFARAWLDGYEVEKEKRYLVRVKGISGYGRYLNKALLSKEYFFASENEVSGYRTKHTRKELEEAGFGWVFDCEGIEIEEVE